MSATTASKAWPWPVPDEALDAAAEAIRNTMLGRDYGGSPSDFRTDLRAAVAAAMPFVMFGPLGDNHHNAALCPYCSPEVRRG